MQSFRVAAGVALLAVLSGCQSSAPVASTAPSTAAPILDEPDTAVAADSGAAAAVAYAAPQSPAAAACAMPIAGGPPPKPAKGADFGTATAKNLGKNVGRNVFAGIVGRAAGPLGGAVAHGVALNAVRPEQDLKGVWTATDGAPDCGCAVEISSGINLQGKSSDAGSLTASTCVNPLLARAARWTLGHSFTGYDAPFQLLARDGTTLATLNRDGVDYFSGSLADGTPVTLWRK